MSNPDLNFRPVISGTSILNARVNEPGTIGYIATDNTGALWIVSAYHVLCNSTLLAYTADEPIYQPAAIAPEYKIALTSITRANPDLDCAAAELLPGITGLNYQLAIGPTAAPTRPTAGMRVIKSGAVSGVTEGIILSVNDPDVLIQTDLTYPTDYTLTLPGDSGSLWLDQQTHAPVALHCGSPSARHAATKSFPIVLAALNLKPLS
jgi:hypothetical protein